ncbi:hypothetical protein BDN67DRAFT_916912 [Paxillus ammoniavirescens]|nr:hypothetical protein BDN67DRAFT_916912 [Paxillus ammoniavirescens]
MDSNSQSGQPPKRGRGRPKGSKNKPTAQKVSRPRKDGQPPQKWYKGNDNGESSSTAIDLSVSSPDTSDSGPRPSNSPSANNVAMELNQLINQLSATTFVDPSMPVPPVTTERTAGAAPASTAIHAAPLVMSKSTTVTQSTRVSIVKEKCPWRHTDNIYGSDTWPSGDAAQEVADVHEDEADEDLKDEFRPQADDEEEGDGVVGFTIGVTTPGNVNSKPRRARASMPIWLDAHCKAVESMLKAEIQQSTRNPPRPKCYEEGNFLTDGCRTTSGGPIFLQKLGWIGKARRIVDVDRNVYLIGYRYRCVAPGCHKTYRSWSPAILNILPVAVAMQFPFQLTYRSGLTNELAELLQSSIRSGLGPTPFTEMLQSFHYKQFDKLHLQYLELVHDHYKACPKHFWVPKTPFGSFHDRNGYAGFVPTQGYLRRFYDMVIERSAPEMKQSIAMLPARVLAIDHSFKRLGKVGSAPLFTALHTVTNEYVEIHSMLFTMTKGHEHFIPNLHEINHSLKMFGHADVEVVFTDNVRSDKEEVQRAFPSLLKDVVPVPPHSDLPVLKLPDHSWGVIELSTAHQINLHFDIIMNHRTPENPNVTVVFDMEWPVNLETGVQGPVALIQIAYQNTVYLIKTAAFLRDGYIDLPHSFLVFMQSPCFTKVGVGIGADFTRLQRNCHISANNKPFVGQVELGVMAKHRGVQIKKNVSLADLVAVLLHQYLLKDPAVRVSPRWADSALPREYVDYAVLDAYATNQVYLRLAGMKIAPPVTATTPGGTSVILVSPDGNPVAWGIIAMEQPPTLNSINVTPSRSMMTVSQVLVPGFLIPAALCRANHSKPLSSFGTPPFSLLVNISSLRVCINGPADGYSITGHNSEPHAESSVSHPTTTSAAPQPDIATENMPESSTSFIPLAPAEGEDVEEDEDAISMEQRLEGSVRDPASEDALAKVIKPYTTNHQVQAGTPSTVRGRVIYDNFHAYHHIPISRTHGLRRPFLRALSAAFYIPVADDKSAVERVLKKYQVSYNSQLLSKPKWVLARVRRHVPLPEILLPRVAEVIETYGPLKDATSGEPLFNARAWEITKNLMENIRLGYYSDPPGVELYFKTGQDKDQLTLYRCCRGTNSVEGGVHQNLVRHYESCNTGPQHAINAVGTLNRTGKPYAGHFDILLKNRLAHLFDLTRCAWLPDNTVKSGWVNGNDYAPANETFGMIKLLPTFFTPLGMFEYNEDYARNQEIRHKYVAEHQGTLMAVLPVHTHKERDLFQLLAHSSPLFTDATRQPNWNALACIWAGHANGKTIFYKLPEHLKAYYKTWTNFCNKHNTVALNTEASQHIRALVHSRPAGLPASVPTALPVTLQDSLTVSPSVEVEEVSTWQIGNLLDRHSLQQSAILYTYTETARRANTSTAGAMQAASNPRKRKTTAASHGPTDDTPIAGPSSGQHRELEKRKPRKCRNCQSTTCEGRWAVKKCSKPLDPVCAAPVLSSIC